MGESDVPEPQLPSARYVRGTRSLKGVKGVIRVPAGQYDRAMSRLKVTYSHHCILSHFENDFYLLHGGIVEEGYSHGSEINDRGQVITTTHERREGLELIARTLSLPAPKK